MNEEPKKKKWKTQEKPRKTGNEERQKQTNKQIN